MSGFISRHLMDFGVSTVQRSPVPSSPVQKWCPPPSAMVKLNFDAGFDSDGGTGATGAILRDHTGFFVAASCSNIPFVQDAATAEARGLRDGLLLANEMGCNKICVEGDCMEVIEIMQNRGNSLGPAAAIYEECSFLARNFISIVFSHCPREANMAADLLARNSEVSRTIVWNRSLRIF